MTLRRLVLWRHGETDYNATGRIQGHLDTLLTATGQVQAQRSAPVIAGLRPEVARSSDLRRASVTAEAFAELTGAPVSLDKRLRETRLGQWQGLTHDQVEAGWPGALAVWRSDPTWVPPGGESKIEVAERASEVVAELELGGYGSALLCTHGGLIAALTAQLLGWPEDLWPGLAGVANCHWVLLARRDGERRWRLMTYNGGFPAEFPD